MSEYVSPGSRRSSTTRSSRRDETSTLTPRGLGSPRDLARANLERQAVTAARVVVGDGSEGLAEHAPYDAIVVAAAFPTVPPPLVAQLAEDGRLVQPIGPGGAEDVMLFRNEGPNRLRSVRH